MAWTPPGKNCGLCGESSCASFLASVAAQCKEVQDCPFYVDSNAGNHTDFIATAAHNGRDVLGNPYDFVLAPLPGEVSARKIVLPFRGDLVEKLNIKRGDYVLGRPMGAGCPVPHVLEVVEAQALTGLLYTWVVGPSYGRQGSVKDVVAYHMIGFEGIATHIRRMPQFGRRVTFLPGFCMMNLNHTGVANMLLEKQHGLHVRLEDVRILAG